MSRNPLEIVAVSGGVRHPSRTRALVESLLAELSAVLPIRHSLIDLGELAPQYGGILDRNHLPQAVADALDAVESADALIVASPIYRGSYTGLFKHFFDLVDQDALIDIPILLAATGGSDRHSLAIDHQFRPLFSFFQAQTLPIGVYGTDPDFEHHRVSSEALRARIALAVSRAVPILASRREGMGSPRAVHDGSKAPVRTTIPRESASPDRSKPAPIDVGQVSVSL